MKRSLLLSTVVLLTCVVAFAQVNPKISEIKRGPQRFVDEVVTIEGFVTQYVEDAAHSTKFFYLKDDWGGIIKVRTSGMRPDVGRRYRVSGPVSIDPKYGRGGSIHLGRET